MIYVLGTRQEYISQCKELKVNPHANDFVCQLHSPASVMGRTFSEKDQFILGTSEQQARYSVEMLNYIRVKGGNI